MLQIKGITKQYITGDFVQTALDGVDLCLRDSEFVAVLGPSGSGKTTLLNVIGGLDRYDSGDLVINNVSTKEYKDKDWDSYRNHSVGFIFQNYNLISHQSVLANVELSMTIGGVKGKARKQKAMEALKKVGLEEHAHKKPNQLSGGQMQRVAIARALVNDPDILLADEPTGALDSVTSIQIMELLKEVAKDRLVVMVTHNPELADRYASRIVRLQDGRIIADSDPFVPATEEKSVFRNFGRSFMNFFTSLALSFNNLRTKKGRTILTAFAGSIGIIGIALILSLSNGVEDYIKSVEEDTLSEYPLTITETAMDLSTFLDNAREDNDQKDGEVKEISTLSTILKTASKNDLKSFFSYISDEKNGILSHSKAVELSYSVTPRIYRLSGDKYRQINPDMLFGGGNYSGFSSFMSPTSYFTPLPANGSLYLEQYELLRGTWPKDRNECILVLSRSSSVTDLLLYAVGLKDSDELDRMVESYRKGTEVYIADDHGTYKYDDFMGITFKVVDAFEQYDYDPEFQVYVDKSDNEKYMLDKVKKGEDLKIVGVAIPKDDSTATMLSGGIYYHPDLTLHVIEKAASSEIVNKQLSDRDTDVFTGKGFDDKEDQTLDLNDIVSFDEEAFKEAFSFDKDSFSIDAKDLDLGSMKLDLSGADIPVSAEDLTGLLSGIDVKVDTEQLKALLQELYQAYEKSEGAVTGNDVVNSFREYTASGRPEKIIREALSGITANIDQEAVDALIDDIGKGFQSYLAGKDDIDPNEIGTYFREYIGTQEVRNMVSKFIDSESRNIDISDEEISSMTKALYEDYKAYALENSFGGPEDMVKSFSSFIRSEEGEKIISEGMKKALNSEEIEKQVSDKLKGTMEKYGSAVMNAISKELARAFRRVFSKLPGKISEAMEKSFSVDPEKFQKAIVFNMDADDLQELMMSMVSSASSSYSNNLYRLDYVDTEEPSAIYIYPKDFESKELITELIEKYNEKVEKDEPEKVIRYTDYVKTLMGSVTTIIDTISYVLVAFVAISLIVSSIMIGIITYISVLERTKEIGILRAIGASKRNISQVFNAETFIIGLMAGVIGIGTSLLILIPGNAVIHALTKNPDISAKLPPLAGVILIIISIVLTLIGGIIPSRAAARKDPVAALRTE
ncbi:MAG: ABC transporter ATP-binding protein/permease [Clostridia bacterium]|nr:ABC transporter ATP-binding protein/permease [Clostridia bacterium]